MFFLDFLKQSVPEDDAITRSFIDIMVPQLLKNYVGISAKGGTHQDNDALSEKTKRDFETLHDQSMFSHLINGVFPSLRLMRILEDEGIEQFSDIERYIYIYSYLMHDIDKINGQRPETKNREAIEELKSSLAKELQKNKAEEFFPHFLEYLEDIAFLVVNTQRTWGTSLVSHLWQLRLPKRIPWLRDLCTFSDLIAYAAASPAEILQADRLKEYLDILSDHKLTFHYHQLRDVRGLFTNVINNSLISLFTDDKQRKGTWPYLFFSNGVVYLARKTVKFSLTNEQIVEEVKKQLQQICSTRIKQDAPGFSFSNKGAATHPEYYFEFLSLDDYLHILVDNTINRTVRDITEKPFERLREMQASGEIAADLLQDLSLTPDLRTSRLARFLSVIFTTVLEMLNKSQQELYKQVEQDIVHFLGLERYWEESKVIPNKGGVDYRWFWLAARYIQENPGTDEYDGAKSLQIIFEGCFALIKERAGKELEQAMQEQQRYLMHLSHYLETIVELPHTIRDGGMLPDFSSELAGYASAKWEGRGKGKTKKLICTLCNSAYPTEAQSDSTTLFQPWVYKNKMSLYAGTNAGGVCAICALELMLRQLQQKGDLRLTGGKFEAMKTKYLTIYPNYFFTAETGAMVQGILDQLWDMNFFTLRQQLTGEDITVEDVMYSQMFVSDPTEKPKGPRVVSDPDDLEDDDNVSLDDLLNGTNLEKTPEKEDHDYGFIKYEYPSNTYPNICFFGMRAGKDDTDTEAWAMPALLALALPLVTGAKVVISELLLPLFASGHDFLETVVFDAPHPYLGRLLGTARSGKAGEDQTGSTQRNRVRVNRVLNKLSLLVQIYQMNVETYAKKGKPEWQHLSTIVRNIETDPMYVFSYLREQERRGTTSFAYRVKAYRSIYQRICRELLGPRICQGMLDMNIQEENDLGNIQKCVELYTTFYRGGYESHSILKPIDTVAKAIIKSPLDIDEEDLLWQIQGEIKNWLDRVRSRQATGYAIFWGKDIDTKEAQAIREFITYFYKQVFSTYCQGERGILRSRLNRFRDGCEAYYVHLRTTQRIQEKQEQEQDNQE